jgi:7,8-dihydropterin-6-yl-methyl-4-(beta-D-ribofuranosyl)aminobenzene 5'-phosphate synthase
MSFRISPLWWPVLLAASPALIPILIAQNGRFRGNASQAAELNRRRLAAAAPLPLPPLEFLEITVLVEGKARPGFLDDAGVSWLIRTDRGSLLFDVGFGPERRSLGYNAAKLGAALPVIDALAISHLHFDHMGGLAAMRAGQVRLPDALGRPSGQPCYLPAPASAEGMDCQVVAAPRLLSAGIATTGPLARSLFFMGMVEEQALVARLRGKGLVVLTGCGHPGIGPILEMVRRNCDEPIYAVGGGLHLPITDGRGNRAGIRLQMIMGTGKPPWRRLTERDLDPVIATLNAAAPSKVFLSAHDSCDHALSRLQRELTADTVVLEAGSTYRID